MKKLEKSEMMVSWALEVTEFAIMFQPKNAIKAQALADIIVECIIPGEQIDDEARKTLTCNMTHPPLQL